MLKQYGRVVLWFFLCACLPLGAHAESSVSATGNASMSVAAQAPQISNSPVISPQIVNPISVGADRAGADAALQKNASPAVVTSLVHNEFQNFVSQAVGQPLPLFGYNLFEGEPSTFAPLDRVPVTADYVIGPGDEILVRAWGQIDIDYRAVVDRGGAIQIPKVGTINVAGARYQDLHGHLKTAIGRVFRNFELSVNLGQLRAIQVFVVGQARRPGVYTISSLSTLVNAVFASGGPSSKGSMRHIQLKRDDKVIADFDLYDLLIKGDKSKDVKLLPGDVLFFPAIGKLLAISGSVNVPAIYEMKDGDTTLKDLVELAGGLTTTAAGQKVTVERIDNRKSRRVEDFALDEAGYARVLQDGDMVTVLSISPRFENAVTLRGSVAAPLRYPFRQGMRVKDLIPEREALISSDYWIKRNMATRVDVSGQAALRTEVKRSFHEINWDYAVVERLNLSDLTTTLIPFNLGKAVIDADPAQNIALQAGDVITIFSKDDIQVPLAKQSKYVRLEGEFKHAGVYKVEPGETLRQLVARVGGLTQNAYLYGAEFARESTRAMQQKKMDEALDRMEREFQRVAATRARNVTGADEAGAAKAEAESRQGLLARLRQVRATGRIVLELPQEGAQMKDLPDMSLEDGDRFVVPSAPSTVSVLGAVYNESNFIYKPEKRVADYLAQAGGPTKDADSRSLYVLRADGSVVSKRQAGWVVGGFGWETVMPGDVIYVPEETDKTTLTKDIKDWTQILYQFGLGAAALKVLK